MLCWGDEVQDNNIELAAIGKENSVIAFRAAGVHTVAVKTSDEVKLKIEALARSGCKLIFITEETAKMAEETIDKYRFKTFPIILTVSSENGNDSLSMKKVYDNIEKALGTRKINNL